MLGQQLIFEFKLHMNRLFKQKEFNLNRKDQKIFIKEIRRNIKDLNHSMQSIEKMIERSRNLFRDPPSPNTYSIEKDKIKISNNFSVLNKEKIHYPLFQNKSNKKLCNHDKKINKTFKHSQTQNSLNNFSFVESTKIINQTRFLNRSIQKICEGLYHFSPQKTKKHISLSTISINKSNQNPQVHSKIILKPKHIRFLSDENSNHDYSLSGKKFIKLGRSDKNLPTYNKSRQCKCKTEYKDEEQQRFKYKNNHINLAQKNSKRHISLKLFCKQSSKKNQDQQFKQILIDKSYKIQPPYLLKMKLLQKKQKQDQKTLYSKEQKKNRFIQKITQYKFVENYLTKNQIWEIYNKLLSENIPQLKWPIVIVDEVYKKIQNSQ